MYKFLLGVILIRRSNQLPCSLDVKINNFQIQNFSKNLSNCCGNCTNEKKFFFNQIIILKQSTATNTDHVFYCFTKTYFPQILTQVRELEKRKF